MSSPGPWHRSAFPSACLYAQEVPEGKTRRKREVALAELFGEVGELRRILSGSNPAVASLEFIRRLTEGEGLIG